MQNYSRQDVIAGSTRILTLRVGDCLAATETGAGHPAGAGKDRPRARRLLLPAAPARVVLPPAAPAPVLWYSETRKHDLFQTAHHPNFVTYTLVVVSISVQL